MSPPRKSREKERHHSRYDQSLFAAKKAQREVSFTLAVETPYTDEDCCCKVVISQVDKYDIEVEDNGRFFWIKKSAIVTTEVHA